MPHQPRQIGLRHAAQFRRGLIKAGGLPKNVKSQWAAARLAQQILKSCFSK